MSESVQSDDRSTTMHPTHQSQLIVRSPANGEVIGELVPTSTAELALLVRSARQAQLRWAETTLEERARIVESMGEALVAAAERLVDTIVHETGKPRFEALVHELVPAVDACRHFARNAERILEDRAIELHLLRHRKSYLTHVPLGVVGVITPWSLPLGVGMNVVARALLAGNAVIVKPSGSAPFSMIRAREIAIEAGVPPELFVLIHGGAETGRALIDAPIDKLFFTGHRETGRKIAAHCGERLLPCVLELGGKATLLACDDCDVERTARAVVQGSFAQAGQLCVGIGRVIAHQKIHVALVDRVVELVRALRVGNPLTHEVDVGAVASIDAMDRTEDLIRDATQKGAIVRIGGQRSGGAGHFFEPTVLENCVPQMEIWRTETLAPIVAVMSMADEQEGIRVANMQESGLFSYVFSKDRDRACAIAEQLSAGTVMVNDVLSTLLAAELPAGGIKQSGMGVVDADDALRAMCHARHVNHERVGMPASDPWWFPYTPRRYKLAMTALRAIFGRHGLWGRITDLF